MQISLHTNTTHGEKMVPIRQSTENSHQQTISRFELELLLQQGLLNPHQLFASKVQTYELIENK